MIQLIETLGEVTYDAEVLPPVRPRRPATSNPMLLHCGGEVVERQALFAVPTPAPTETWFPLAISYLLLFFDENNEEIKRGVEGVRS